MSFKSPYKDAASLPLVGNTTGDVRAVLDTGSVYDWNGSAWVDTGTKIHLTAVPTSLDQMVTGTTNKFYTTTDFVADLATKSTSDLAEGTNLYYTTARFNTDFSGRSTTNLAEGTNLYYTDVRARTALSATSPLSYDNTTGTFSVDLSAYAPLASPALTGVPTAPTATVGTSTTQIATTAFVLSQGFLGATGSMPYAYQASTSVVTNATSTYSTAISTTITVTASSAPVQARAVGTFTVTGAIPTVAKIRVSINGVAGQEQLLSLTALTTNYIGVAQYTSAALTPGTYTILFEIARNSGTGTVSFFEGALGAIALQGSSSNGITQLTGALQAGPGSGSQVLSGVLPLANGGSNSNFTAANGAVLYSTATAFGKTAVGSANQMLQSAGAASPVWSTATYPATTVINQILYSSAANVVSGLATANTGALVTSSTGVPSITSGATANRLLRTNGTTVSFAQVALATDVSGTLPVANGGTGLTSVASNRIPFGTGSTALSTSANFTFDTATNRLGVGGTGTAIGNFVNTGSSVALQAYNQGTNNAFQALNQSAYTISMVSRQNNATTGATLAGEFGRGTLASPLQALSGDQLMFIGANGYTGTQTAPGYCGAIVFLATENVTNTANGGDLIFATTPNGTLAPVERLRLTNDGLAKFKNGTTIDTSVAQPAAAAAYRGTLWVIQGGAGVADIVQICVKDATDTYVWVTL